jgi:phage head maturation protease
MTGEALRLRIETARLMRKHQVEPKPFCPVALLPSVDHDVIVEGYAAPSVVDREFTKFSTNCWTAFKKDIPLLFRHERPAGEVEEVRCDDRGLYVRALVTDLEARRCSYFSVGATIHNFEMRDIDDRERFHGLITSATLDEVSLTNIPANPAAIILRRYEQSPMAKMYSAAGRAVSCMIGIVEDRKSVV